MTKDNEDEKTETPLSQSELKDLLDDVVRVKGKILFEFLSFQVWVNTAQRKFASVNLNQNQHLCVDTQGNVLVKGLEFQRARDNGWFPVSVYQVII